MVKLSISYILDAYDVKSPIKFVKEEGLDLSQAARRVGMTDSEKIGNEKGIINILTKGRFVRGDQIKSALQMALIQLENPKWYE